MENQKTDELFKKIVSVDGVDGTLKVQHTIELSFWDQAKMEGYTPGRYPPKTGYSCMISTLKPDKKYPKSRIDIDPSNMALRQAIADMYDKFDQIVGKSTK